MTPKIECGALVYLVALKPKRVRARTTTIDLRRTPKSKQGDPDGQNLERAAWALVAVRAFQETTIRRGSWRAGIRRWNGRSEITARRRRYSSAVSPQRG